MALDLGGEKSLIIFTREAGPRDSSPSFDARLESSAHKG